MSHKNQPPYFPNNKKQLVSTQTSITHISSSPIPSAEELAKYEAVKPGITDIILSTYQKQVEHRINIENSVITHKNMNTTIGQVFILCKFLRNRLLSRFFEGRMIWQIN